MCGVAGVIDLHRGVDPDAIKRMTDILSHRGPDAEGFYFFSGSNGKLTQSYVAPDFRAIYALGHRRLSILDLAGGAQPLSNENGEIWITYNGEIYNCNELREELALLGHAFKTQGSDTEVIIHAYEEWGIEGFNRFNGIFAFGILDLQAKRLVLARDPFGVKPIYYYRAEDLLIFSSEIKSLLEYGKIPAKLNMKGLHSFLTFRYVPSPETTFENIYKIEAGGYVEFDLNSTNKIREGTYVSHGVEIDTNINFNQAVEQYRELFEAAVKRQLLSDVPVGALLSGGVDSSAVCAIASQNLGYPLRTYTVGFEDSPLANETVEATDFARQIGATHRNLIVSESEFIDALENVAWFMDEPTATSSAIPLFYLTSEIKKEVKVVLTGQGADEPLAGYPRYYGERLYQYGFKYMGWFKPVIDFLPRNEQLKRAFRCFSIHDDFERILNYYYLFTPAQLRTLYKKTVVNNLREGLIYKLFNAYKPDDSLGRILFIDTRAWLPDDLLVYGDKATMINSIEARVPILDKELIAFIEKIPSRFKLSSTMQGKYLHKKACEKWLPDSVLKRKKTGFATPVDQWFRGEMSGYVRERLLSGGFCAGLFNKAYIENMIHEHATGRTDFQRQLFSLLMLEMWGKKFSVSI